MYILYIHRHAHLGFQGLDKIMKNITLDTQDYRCPEVMIRVRRFLSAELKSGTACTIKTIEPSTQRDVPFYCAHMGHHVHSQTKLPDGTFEFVITANESEVPVQNNAVEIVNVQAERDGRDKELHAIYESIIGELYSLIAEGYMLVIPSSFGKDSSLVLSAAVVAHLRAIKDEIITASHPFVVIHIDTANESIPMHMYSHYAMRKLETYCEENGINLSLHHETPPLYNQFASLFLGARKLPSTPSLNSDCAVIFKVDTSHKIQKELMARYDASKLVSCIGSRHDEGTKRSASIKKFDNNKSATMLINENQDGLNTFAPIRDLSNEEVFELLQRIGETPMIVPTPGNRMDGFLKSNRLLIQIYGDSASDTCEINIGANDQKVACGGSARNGCLNCFKAGKVDKSVVAHNRSVRWSAIQGNANKVRDFMYSVAHDVTCRTHHPRAFDPVTNHAMLQPNILNSRTLERLLTYYVQLTHDDYLRAQKFKALVNAGTPEKDPGYAEILNDLSIHDEQTRAEFLDMYKEGAQQHLINVANLDHCIYLSALWAMDGVKSVPFRPLGIYNEVVKKGNRIPYPDVDTTKAPNDTIGDAMAIKLSEPGIDLLSMHIAPFRPWDIFDSDKNLGCMSELVPQSLRANVHYSRISEREVLRVKVNGKAFTPGKYTKEALLKKARTRWNEQSTAAPISFTQLLTQRKMVVVGKSLREQPAKADKVQGATRRAVKRGASGIIRQKTSLRMYAPQPVPSLENAWMKSEQVWAPDHVLVEKPYISQHQTMVEESAPNFEVTPALAEWLDFGGYEKAIRMHDDAIKSLRRVKRKEDGKMTLRQFVNTDAFWELTQAGVISVNLNTWYTAQKTLKRTEIFNYAGLFNLPNSAEELASMDGVLLMNQHRSVKANALLEIRRQRNQRRKAVKRFKALNPSVLVEEISTRITRLFDIKHQVQSPSWIAMKVMVGAGVTGFDQADFVSAVKLSDEWLEEFSPAFNSVDDVLSLVASKTETAAVNASPSAKGDLATYLTGLRTEHAEKLTNAMREWNNVLSAVEQAEHLNEDGVYSQAALDLVEKALPEMPSVNLAMASSFLASTLSGNKQSLMSDDVTKTLSDQWHQPKIDGAKAAMQELEKLVAQVQKGARNDTFGKLTSDGRNNALLALM